MESELFSLSTDALSAVSSQLPGFMAKLEAVEDRQLKLFDRFEANESVTSALCVAINDLVKVLVAWKAAGREGAFAAEATYINTAQEEFRETKNKYITNSELSTHGCELSPAASEMSAASEDATSECSTAHASNASASADPSIVTIRNKKSRRRYRKRKNSRWFSQQKVLPYNDRDRRESWDGPQLFPGVGNQWDDRENWGDYQQELQRGSQNGGPWGRFNRPPAGRPTAAPLMGRPRYADFGRWHGDHWRRSRGLSQDTRMKIIDILNSYQDYTVSAGPNYKHY